MCEHAPLRNEEDCLELKLTLHREVFHSEMIFPVIGQALVERAILLLGDVTGITSPERLRLVKLLILYGLLLDLLGLLFLILVLINFLNLGLLTLLFFLLLSLIIFDLLYTLI